MRYLRFFIPPIVVVVIDLMLQLGAWERIASPESHAGMSVAKKTALEDPAFRHIDFVTLGSSRPVYGIDHALLAKSAAEHNQTWVNLTVAGAHWMSLDVMTQWLAQHHPELRGGMIALSIQDFMAPGNGTYELGIAYPFRTFNEIPEMAQHVPFDWHDPATYGLYSGLFEYHEDMQDLLAHPQRRSKLLRYFHALSPQQVLAGNADETSGMCATPVSTLADCVNLERQGHVADPRIVAQCKQLHGWAGVRPDLQPFLHGLAADERLQRARDLIRARLRSLNWPIPPLVVLMPTPSVWLNEALPAGAHEWALSVLEPLLAEKKISLLDYTKMFSGDAECGAFFDLYHNNVSGRQKIMEHLMPEVGRNLFRSTSESGVLLPVAGSSTFR